MTRREQLESKIDALLEEFKDMSYEELEDVFDYFTSDITAKANRDRRLCE